MVLAALSIPERIHPDSSAAAVSAAAVGRIDVESGHAFRWHFSTVPDPETVSRWVCAIPGPEPLARGAMVVLDPEPVARWVRQC